MKRITQNLRWLVTLLTMIVSVGAWAEETATIATATFNGKNETYTTGWTTTGTGLGRTDCVIIGAGENITSPAFDLSGYSSVTITFTGRRYGSLSGSKATVDASIGGTSVGTIDITEKSVATVDGNITFTPTSSMTAAVLVFTCTNATSPGSTHGAGIGSITITGTTSGGTPTPTIIVNPATVNVPAEGGNGTIKVTYQAFEPESFDIEFCESDGTPLEGDGPDWITAECEYPEEGNVVNYLIDPNDGEARTAYFRVYSFDTEENAVYSEIITVTQAAAPQAYTLTITPNDNAEIYVFYEQDQSSPIANSDDMLSNNNVLSTKEILISASAKEGYVLESVTVTDGNGDNISLNDVEGEEEGTAWTFIMPESNVTISCTVNEVVPAEKLTFVKVTSTADLVAGGEYIIVCESENKVMTSYGVGSSKVFNQEGITINNSTVTIEEGVANILTLGGTTGAWTLQTSLEGKYVSLTKSSNELHCEDFADEDSRKWTISFDGSGNCVITSKAYTSRTIQYNSGSPRFATYTSTQKPIQLYKKPSVTIGASKWATYVAEDNVTFPSEVSAYTVETIDTENSKVALGEVIAVKKGTPILVYSETPNTYTLEVVEEGVCDETFNNKLKVSDGAVPGGSTIYVLAQPQNSEIGFYPLASNVTVPAGKAYLEIIESKAPVKGFFALGELADAINNIAVEKANGTIFNIAGQKVQNITKGGLYIVNGKKVIVK